MNTNKRVGGALAVVLGVVDGLQWWVTGRVLAQIIANPIPSVDDQAVDRLPSAFVVLETVPPNQDLNVAIVTYSPTLKFADPEFAEVVLG